MVRCTVSNDVNSQLWLQHTSDAGQLMRASHGARRSDGYKAVPEKLARHSWRALAWNPDGATQRDTISCRKEHRASLRGRFIAGFAASGAPLSRAGFIVDCDTDADCARECPRHPLTASTYQCSKRYNLYDYAVTGDSSDDTRLVNDSAGSATAFDPLPISEGGKSGICVDAPAEYNQFCDSSTLNDVTMGIVGCPSAFVLFWLCGLTLETRSGDSTTAALTGDAFYPRTLIAGRTDPDGDGISDAELKCYDPVDCAGKCRTLERTSTHGAGAPPACAMCAINCPNNFVSTVVDLVDAMWKDLLTLTRLLGVCFGRAGPAGCTCQLMLLLEPAWRKNTNDDRLKCRNGDPLQLLMGQLSDLMLSFVEGGVNTVFVNPINSFLSALRNIKLFGWKPFGWIDLIPKLCIPTGYKPERCDNGGLTREEMIAFANCEDESKPLEQLCFYKRVETICSSNDLFEGYDGLFDAGHQDLTELEADIKEAFVDASDYLDPTLVDLLQELQRSATEAPDLEDRQRICDSASFASALRLDQLVVSCIFAVIEGACLDDVEDGNSMSYEIDNANFLLPSVRFSYTVRCAS